MSLLDKYLDESFADDVMAQAKKYEDDYKKQHGDPLKSLKDSIADNDKRLQKINDFKAGKITYDELKPFLMMKESVETKLNIYEAYDNGIITESEKADLLLIIEEAEVSKKKQKILDNQDELKKNFAKISSDLKKMVVSSAGDYDIKMEDKKFFRDHEDHKEQHYLLEYTLKPTDDIPKSKVAGILHDIGDKVEKEFKKDKKDFLDKGLYFDNNKKDDDTRFVELHYDFY